MLKVAIYARVSTAEQAEEGYSIDAQLNLVEEKCIREGKVVVERYVDAGISGKSMKNRPALQKLIRDSKERVFNEVYVWKTNRLARNHLELVTIVHELEKSNIAFRSCSEPYESSTPSGKLMMNLLSSIGEFERSTIVENVKMGMKQRARSGKWNGGTVLGYKTEVDPLNKEKTKLQIVEKEAAMVKKIFSLYAEGKGFKAIVNIINAEGFRTKKGNLFSISGVKEILENPLYMGKIRYNLRENWSQTRRSGINKNPIICEGEHSAIVSEELWIRVQAIHNERTNKPARTFYGSYPLTGLLKCPECGASMVAGRVSKKRSDGTKHTIRYYQCSAWKNKGSIACKPNSIRAEKVEEYVFHRISSIFSSDKLIEKVVGKASNRNLGKVAEVKEELQAINKNISDLDMKKMKIFDLYEEDIIDKDVLQDRMLNIQKNIEESLSRRANVEDQLTNMKEITVDIQEIKQLMKDFCKVLERCENNRKKILLNSAINKITIKDKKSVDTIKININSGMKRYLQDKEEESDKEDSSSFCFMIEI